MSVNDIQIGGSHYKSTMQHWDFVEMHGLGYIEGNATKYLTRWKKKNGVEDLEKALHYIDKLISLAEEIGRKNRGYISNRVIKTFLVENNIDHDESLVIMCLCSWQDVGDLHTGREILLEIIEKAKQPKE